MKKSLSDASRLGFQTSPVSRRNASVGGEAWADLAFAAERRFILREERSFLEAVPSMLAARDASSDRGEQG